MGLINSLFKFSGATSALIDAFHPADRFRNCLKQNEVPEEDEEQRRKRWRAVLKARRRHGRPFKARPIINLSR